MTLATPRSAPAGSRRFWVTVLCFALANLGIWIGYAHFTHRHATLLEVRQFAPSSDSEVSGRPNFWWTFNLDVAPGKPGDPPPGTISPEVPGRWKWDGPRSLNFTPDSSLPKATAFTLTLLSDRLQTPDGFRLKNPHVTTVRSAPLTVLGISQSAFDERDRLVLEIQFNDDVIPAEALSHLELRSFDGRPVAFQPYGEGIGHLIRVITNPLPTPPADEHDAIVHVAITPGLIGRSGPLGPWNWLAPTPCSLVAAEPLIAFALSRAGRCWGRFQKPTARAECARKRHAATSHGRPVPAVGVETPGAPR
jgi:hypothetical protein